MPLQFKLILSLGLFAAGFIGGWMTNGWRLDSKLSALQANYANAALVAQEQAKEKEQADLANIQKQSLGAIQQAQDAKDKAEANLTAYQKRLASIPKTADLPHLCANQPLPVELRP